MSWLELTCVTLFSGVVGVMSAGIASRYAEGYKAFPLVLYMMVLVFAGMILGVISQQ